MNPTKVQENTIIYPNLSKLVNVKETYVKPFLPLLRKYTFLEVHTELKHLQNMYAYLKGIKPEDGLFYRVGEVVDYAISMHGLLEGWEIGAHQSLDKYFYGLAHVDAGPLEFCGYIDLMLHELSVANDGSLERVVVVMLELRRAFLRAFAIENKIDLSAYLEYAPE